MQFIKVRCIVHDIMAENSLGRSALARVEELKVRHSSADNIIWHRITGRGVRKE